MILFFGDPESKVFALETNDELDNFSGVTAPYEMPNNSDLIIDTENSSIEDCTINILNFLKSNNLISTSIEIAKK